MIQVLKPSRAASSGRLFLFMKRNGADNGYEFTDDGITGSQHSGRVCRSGVVDIMDERTYDSEFNYFAEFRGVRRCRMRRQRDIVTR